MLAKPTNQPCSRQMSSGARSSMIQGSEPTKTLLPLPCLRFVSTPTHTDSTAEFVSYDWHQLHQEFVFLICYIMLQNISTCCNTDLHIPRYFYSSGPVANKLTRPRNTWADSWCARKSSPSTFHTPSLPNDVNVKAGVCPRAWKESEFMRIEAGKEVHKEDEEIYFMVFDKFEAQGFPTFPSKLNKVPAYETNYS